MSPSRARQRVTAPPGRIVINVSTKEDHVSNYVKAIAAVVGAVALFVLEAVGPDGTAGQIATIVVGVLTALGVYQLPNRAPT